MHLIIKIGIKMEKWNKDSYEAVHEIAEEILEAIKERRSVAECEKLLDFLQDDVPDREFLERMASEELFTRYYTRRAARDKQQDVQRLVESLNTLRRKKVYTRRLRLRISSIAAAVVVFGFFVWSFVGNRMEEYSKEIPLEQNLQSGKPTLVLNNGLRLELRDVDNKLPATQYGIKEIAPDRVAYDRIDTTKKEVEYNTLIVPVGYNYGVKLADGSEIILNGRSRLKYVVSGVNASREVELEGEAYFKVTKSIHPFVVKMGNSSVKVYGTEFNTYKDGEGDIEVVLVKGSVGFSTGDGEEMMLKPNQKCVYNSVDGDVHVSDVEVGAYIAWLNDEFNYDQVSLDYFLKKVSAWYGVQFKYDKKRFEAIQFYVSTKRSVALSDLLLLIEKSTNLTFIRESENVFIVR